MNEHISRQSRQANERVAQGRCARCGIIRKPDKGATGRLCGECASKAREEWKRRKKPQRPTKPALTVDMAAKLRVLAAYAQTEINMISARPDDPAFAAFRADIVAASEWITQLSAWREHSH